MAMLDDGLPIKEIATRFNRSPEHVRNMIRWTRQAGATTGTHRAPEALERRVIALRAAGIAYEEIGRRFRRSGRFIRQVEAFAHVRQDDAVGDHARALLEQAGDEARTRTSKPRLPHPDVTSEEEPA